MNMWAFLDTAVNIFPLIMVLPSVIISCFTMYVIRTKSPVSMKQYKMVLIVQTVITLIFDLMFSVLVSPKPLPGAIGLQLDGLFPKLLPSEGRGITYALVMSLFLHFDATTFGFCYREYTFLHQADTAIHKYGRIVAFVVELSFFISFTPQYYHMVANEEEARNHMSSINVSYCEECAIFVIVNMRALQFSGAHFFFAIASLMALVIVSIKRINNALKSHQKHMSMQTMRQQKMLLSALIWQSVIPFMLVVLPTLILSTISLVISPEDISARNEFGENLTAFSLTTPALFAISHDISILYFTTPYRNFILRKAGIDGGRTTSTTVTTMTRDQKRDYSTVVN